MVLWLYLKFTLGENCSLKKRRTILLEHSIAIICSPMKEIEVECDEFFNMQPSVKEDRLGERDPITHT